jgi:hypothetical protein
MSKQAATTNVVSVPTAGEIFSDGSVIELLRDPSTQKLNLVRGHTDSFQIGGTIRHADRLYSPLAINPTIAAATRFPTRVSPSESTVTLSRDVHACLKRYLQQPDAVITAMVFAIFASWFSPALTISPIIFISAPAGSPKDVAMQLLSLFCRRALRLVGAKRGDFLRAPMGFAPTLLLDEPQLSPSMESVLFASAHRNSYVLRGNGIQEMFGPKIVLTGAPLHTAPSANVLEVALEPLAGHLHALDKQERETLAEEYQARFLGHFLRNVTVAQSTHFDARDLTPTLHDLAQAFGAALVGDPEAQAKIIPLLKERDEEIRVNRASALDAVVVEAILFLIHKGGCSQIYTDAIAKTASAIFTGRGIDMNLSAEKVGRALKRLNIPSGRLTSAGNGIQLTAEVCRVVHHLAQVHGVRSMESGPRSDCDYCAEIQGER